MKLWTVISNLFLIQQLLVLSTIYPSVALCADAKRNNTSVQPDIAPTSPTINTTARRHKSRKPKSVVHKNGMSGEEGAPTLANSARGCHEYVSHTSLPEKWNDYWRRRGGKPRLAYKMGVLAAMSYWEFHKWPLPENTTGFSLIRDKGGQSVPCALHRLKKVLVETWTQGNVQLSTHMKSSNISNESHTKISHIPSNCDNSASPKRKAKDKNFLRFEYWMYNWHEPSAPGVSFHDTDILVSTVDKKNTLAITFAGTASTADAITNIQTFEPANHSSFFRGQGNQSVQGSLHRGFLNAYSRVSRGYVLRLNKNYTSVSRSSSVDNLHRKFGHCTGDTKNRKKRRKNRKGGDVDKDTLRDDLESPFGEDAVDFELEETAPGTVKERGVGRCRSAGENLVDIVRDLVLGALNRRETVHLIGHSLGGSLATLSALDVIVNFPETLVSRLHLWTFGAPQITDDIFLRSAIEAAPRLKRFLNDGHRFHRFVTLSDTCKVDAVAVVTEKALNRKWSSRWGGVHGSVVHLAFPKFLLTPEQYSSSAHNSTHPALRKKRTTHSAIAAHALRNYLNGISRESKDHPLQSDLPHELIQWVFGG